MLALFSKEVLMKIFDDRRHVFGSGVHACFRGNDGLHGREHGQDDHHDGNYAGGLRQMSMGKEMGMANTEMSKGNMRGACTHYMKAQKMSMTK
jgi:hypothetical protein